MLSLRRVLLLALVLILVAGVAGYWWQRPMILTGTGYAAHNACAVEAIAGRSDPEADLPPNPLVPVLGTSTEGAETTGAMLKVLARQRAYFTDGFGCTLAEEPPELGRVTRVSGEANPLTTAAPPEAAPEVDAAIGRAFGDDLSEEARAELGTRGVVVLHDGELVGERYADGFDAATPQLGWSMSKSATNLMLGMLVKQGAVSLQDDRLRPGWTDERADITIEDLLRMTSGLEWDETYDLGTPITRMLYLEPDMGSYVAGQPAAHDPGTYQQYSSGSTTLLCDILTDRTGVDADLPRQTLFSSLGLSSAVLEPDATGTPVCSSYMWATPRDWAAMGQFALQRGRWNGARLLPAGWMKRSTTVTPVETSEDPNYAAGWWANRMPDDTLVNPSLPADAYFAQGHDGQWIVVVPSRDLVVVRLGFTPDTEVDDRVVTLTAELLEAL